MLSQIGVGLVERSEYLQQQLFRGITPRCLSVRLVSLKVSLLFHWINHAPSVALVISDIWSNVFKKEKYHIV